MCVKNASNSLFVSDIFCNFAARIFNLLIMIQIVLRNTKNDVGTLAVRIVNRTLGLNTYISMHLKVRLKDWVDSIQMPKNIYDERPVKELNGLSYAQLATIILDVKKLLMAIDDVNNISQAVAKQVIAEAVNKAKFGDDLTNTQPQPAPVKPTFVEFIRQYIDQCESGERLKQKSSKRIKHDSIKAYRSFLARIEEYQEAKKKVIDWDDLNFDFYNDFKQYYINKNYRLNTVGRFIKNMKTMLYAAKDLHLTTRDDFMSRKWFVDREDVDNVYITEERLLEMYRFDMSDSKKLKLCAEKYAKDKEEKQILVSCLKRNLYRKNLSEARDIFLMGCLTGQRVSDYKRINKDMVETITGYRKFVHLEQVKTEKDVYIPYNNIIGEILDKYDGKLPKIYDQDLNQRIKVVGLLLGWTEPAGLMEHRGTMQYQSSKRFCDAIVTHTARRTFATNAYKNGVPLSAIMAITGHSSEEMLRRYLKLNTKERALLAAEAFDKVKKAF